jgi:hypothetical protein
VAAVPATTLVQVAANHHGVNTRPDSAAAISRFLA